MATGDEAADVVLRRKRSLANVICQQFSLDPKVFLDSIVEDDIKSFCTNILKSAGHPPKNNDEVSKWISFAKSYPVDSEACFALLHDLNEELAQKSVLVDDGLKPSEADVIIFCMLHPFVIGLPHTERQKFPHFLRWMDYIQNKENLGELFEKILIENDVIELSKQKAVVKVEEDPNVKKTVQSTKDADNTEVKPNSKKSDVKKVTGSNAATKEKKLPEKEAAEKDKEISICLLNIQVGLIRKAWKHPSADSLLVEEIDVGDAKLRQVVSGLAKYCSPEELTNRRVVLITNVKPGKLRDVMSEGLVLCASNEDHTVVEPLLPPEGAKIGERVLFSGNEGKPEDVLNPKKKQLEKITPHLFTDDKGVATFKGIPFMTSGGPCTSSIPRASIK